MKRWIEKLKRAAAALMGVKPEPPAAATPKVETISQEMKLVSPASLDVGNFQSGEVFMNGIKIGQIGPIDVMTKPGPFGFPMVVNPDLKVPTIVVTPTPAMKAALLKAIAQLYHTPPAAAPVLKPIAKKPGRVHPSIERALLERMAINDGKPFSEANVPDLVRERVAAMDFFGQWQIVGGCKCVSCNTGRHFAFLAAALPSVH